MEIKDSFVAKSAFIVGGALCLLPLTSLYFPPEAMPEVLMLVGLAGMAWHTAGFLMLRALEKVHQAQALKSKAHMDEVFAKRFGSLSQLEV